MCLERTPALEAILAREGELRIGQPRRGLVLAELRQMLLRMLAEPFEAGGVWEYARGRGPGGLVGHDSPSSRERPGLSVAPVRGWARDRRFVDDLSEEWVEPFTRTVGRPPGTQRCYAGSRVKSSAPANTRCRLYHEPPWLTHS